MIYKNAEEIRNIPVHFILCTERSGSSLLSLRLNLSDEILCANEEMAILYFYKTYKNKIRYTDLDIEILVDRFWWMAENSRDLFYTSKQTLKNCLKHYQNELDFSLLARLLYLNFYDEKDKSKIKIILDKQIKCFFHIKELKQIFPNARFIVLVREVKDNIVSKIKRNLFLSSHYLFQTAIWRDSYDNITFLKDADWIFIRYEDFVLNPKSVLHKIWFFIGLEWKDEILEKNIDIHALVEKRGSNLGEKYIQQYKKFHEGLVKPIDSSNIGQYETALTINQINQINTICETQLRFFGYSLTIEKTTFTLLDKFYMMLGSLYRKRLLSFYYTIPLELKVWIRKIRNKKPSV